MTSRASRRGRLSGSSINMNGKSQSQHILELAKELLDDIELGRIPAEKLLLKSSRLARWVGSEETRIWIEYEMIGYNATEPISLKYMSLTGRWTDITENKGYWGPLAQQEATILAQQTKLAAMRIPDTSGEWSNLAIQNVTKNMSDTAQHISTFSAIKSRVLAHLHKFISQVYYEKEFGSLSETIFENYKKDVDGLIASSCRDVLEKIPFVMDRLSDGDEETISQALSTCRRIIDSFADSIFPPTDATLDIGGGNILKLDAGKHLNRINAYVYRNTESQSRKQKIRQNLSNLYDRVSTGVHKEVKAEEAKSLFLNTYLLLGEILHLEVPRETTKA